MYIPYLEELGAVGPPLVGGIILTIMGLYIMFKKDKSRLLLSGSLALAYSFILLAQTLWCLFIYPPFHSELSRYVTTDVFINFPRFFLILAAIVPPLAGSALYMVSGSYMIKKSIRRTENQVAHPKAA
jgi:hypothetical protein